MTQRSWVTVFLAAVLIIGIFLFSRYFRGSDSSGPPPAPDIPPAENSTGIPLTLPAHFSISIFAKNLESPRVLTFDPFGILLISVPALGSVMALPDKNGDGVADDAITVVKGLNRPHGITFQCSSDPDADDPSYCRFIVAESHRVSSYRYDVNTFKATFEKKLVDLPDGGNHVTRSILFLPSPDENKLLISVGSSCNVCNEKDDRRAKILVYDFQTEKLSEFARGLRNSVFMTIHPVTGKVWATEMGRDLLGDDTPPDEINIINGSSPSQNSGQNSAVQNSGSPSVNSGQNSAVNNNGSPSILSGQNFAPQNSGSPSVNSGRNSAPQNFGWPICYGKNIHDTEFDKNTYIRNPCMEPFETPSYIDIPAHSAPLGLAFFPEEGWPQEYWYNLLVAEHGSWNRSEPAGYKIVRYKLDAQGNPPASGPVVEDFITGWLVPSGVEGAPNARNLLAPVEAKGRPVDILIQPGGTIYISDDKMGVIYKLTYNK